MIYRNSDNNYTNLNQVLINRAYGESLFNEAVRLMGGETVEKLINWKESVASSSRTNVRYVVFMARRSYVLFLLLEKMTEEQLEETENQHFLTDSGMLLQCEKLYEYYIHHGKHFPEIVIVDDVLIHGRNINNFLRVLENHLLKIFESKSLETNVTVDYSTVRDAFAEAVTIRVFYCSKGQLLLSPRYLLSLESEEDVELSVLRQLSNQLSSLVLYADVANATYVISEKISAQQMKEVWNKIKQREENDKEIAAIKTVYQNSRQYLLIKYISGNKGHISSIGIVRFIYNQQDDSYRAIPLIILPQLDGKDTEILIDELSARYNSDEFSKWLDRLGKINGKRMLNEFLTLVMSNAFLQVFNADYGIEREQFDFANEIHKLARNYLIESVEQSENSLTKFLKNTKITGEDLNDIIRKVTHDQKELIENSSVNEQLSNQKMISIRRDIEKKFYELGWEDELNAVNCEKKIVFDTRDIFVRKNQDCYSLLKDFMGNKPQEERNYIIAIFLQMMDAGILSLSSFASEDDLVDGFRQFVKAGEQAMFLYPIAMYLYVPMLTMIEQSAGLKRVELESELEDFFESDKCDISEKDKQSIKAYVGKVYQIKQKMVEWNGNYYRKIDLPDKEKNISNMRQLFDQQRKYMREYLEFSRM